MNPRLVLYFVLRLVLWITHRQRQLHDERSALPQTADRADPAAHGLNPQPHDGQAQATATETAVAALVGLMERIEDVRQSVGADAHARIFHTQAHPGVGLKRIGLVAALLQRFHAQTNLAVVGKFHRVAQQIEHHLAQALHIAAAPSGQGRVDVQAETQTFDLGQQGCCGQRLLQASGEVKVFRMQRHFAVLNARQVKNVLYQPQQVFTAALDGIDALGLRRATRRLLQAQQFGTTDHRVQRRAQLMTHGGQKARFRRGCSFGPTAGLLGFHTREIRLRTGVLSVQARNIGQRQRRLQTHFSLHQSPRRVVRPAPHDRHGHRRCGQQRCQQMHATAAQPHAHECSGQQCGDQERPQGPLLFGQRIGGHRGGHQQNAHKQSHIRAAGVADHQHRAHTPTHAG